MIRCDRKKLIPQSKKEDQKYLILLQDQTVIIDSEWEAMKKWKRHYPEKRIVEMLPTNSRLIAHTTSLSKLLENLEQ